MAPLFKRKRKQREEAEIRRPLGENRVVSLNVADTKSTDFEVRKRLIFDFVLVTFTPASGVIVDKIVLKDTVFWQKGHGMDECNCVRTYAKKGNIMFVELIVNKANVPTFEYFYRDYFKWASTDLERFAISFSKHVDLFYVRATPKLNINGKLNPTFFYVNKSMETPVWVITPKPGIWVDRVVDGIVDIWEKNYKSEICTNAVVLHRNKRPAYVYLLVNELELVKQELFFKKDGITWPRVTKEEFVEAARALGCHPETFMNELTLDLSNVGKNFTVESLDVDTVSTRIITPLTGYKVRKVVDGEQLIWKDERSFSTNASKLTYTNPGTYEHKHTLLNLYVRQGEKTSVLHFAKLSGVWSRIDSVKYERMFSQTDDPINTHKHLSVDLKGERKMYMSHFKNKDGLNIHTFHAPVENSKGSTILVHGAFGHFCSDYISYSRKFCLDYEHYSPIAELHDFANANYDTMDSLKMVRTALKERKDCFEHRSLDGLDMFDTGSRFDYKKSFVEALNNMGYSVYGLDLPSHGHSEGVAPTRFYTNSFDDYVEDLLQFINIVKRGKFSDTTQTYEDFTWKDKSYKPRASSELSRRSRENSIEHVGSLGSVSSSQVSEDAQGGTSTPHGSVEQMPTSPLTSDDRMSASKPNSPVHLSKAGLAEYVANATMTEPEWVDEKLYLVGYSMGSNVCIRTINEYYRRTNSPKKLIDGLVCLSGMYQLAAISNPVMQRLASIFISILSFFAPKSPNPIEKLFDFTISYDSLSRLRDPMYAAKKSCNKTLLMIAKATFDLTKNLSHFPDDLPTLMLNSVKDELVNIAGARKVNKLIKNSKLVELKGSVHGLPLPPYVTVVTPVLKDWLSGSL
ncbi:phospholipase [Theileria orientalis]|uniref:Phospholipase n=1 Tax=Theileria orientalis TaxID=68886 RepID=A0A976M620_THEOR|nr:phospholipase [Theileria orientalis]